MSRSITLLRSTAVPRQSHNPLLRYASSNSGPGKGDPTTIAETVKETLKDGLEAVKSGLSSIGETAGITTSSTGSPSSSNLSASTSASSSRLQPQDQDLPSISNSSSPASTSSKPPSTKPKTPSPYNQIYPSDPISRHPSYPHSLPSQMPAIHQSINFPTPLFTAPSEKDYPPNMSSDKSSDRLALLAAVSGLSPGEIRGLSRFTVKLGRVSNQTKKGKIGSFTAMVVVGSPEKGLVGIGRGKGDQVTKAMDSGFHEAVLSLDYVNRYENRTLWGEMEYKWGATTVALRGRPAGFGLHVPPAVHRLLTACGIRDASAKIYGSANPEQVLKCTIQMLHGGSNPPGMGSGTGRAGRRVDKGFGMRSAMEIERERGRYGINVGKRI